MANFNKFYCFVEDLLQGIHKFDSHDIYVYLSNDTPSASADTIKSNLAEIGAGYGYTAGGHQVTVTVSSDGAGTSSVVVSSDPAAWTASGGNIGPFRYVVAYNATATDDPLIGWWDYGSSISLASGETFPANLAATLLTIT